MTPLLLLLAIQPLFTPGAIDPSVTQANIRTTICKKSYTKRVRPPSLYTTNLKRVQMFEFGIKGNLKDIEEDHRVPLEIGGCARCRENLGPQVAPDFHMKDRLENAVRKDVCRKDGDPKQITLKDAQELFLNDWYVEYQRRYVK